MRHGAFYRNDASGLAGGNQLADGRWKLDGDDWDDWHDITTGMAEEGYETMMALGGVGLAIADVSGKEETSADLNRT